MQIHNDINPKVFEAVGDEVSKNIAMSLAKFSNSKYKKIQGRLFIKATPNMEENITKTTAEIAALTKREVAISLKKGIVEKMKHGVTSFRDRLLRSSKEKQR
ncbi:hypothetical protein Fsol_00722 [Candidatus Fokinia solitaria]|uniref:Uncharacterized protein n=1 Tax=Candidatus Fokinia solitaria TaxID=1802984 RepID=A0A2U8BT54_9RICK|nr:hypothetical protein [Candidatus Fokinia solitaria]AWD33498.1 hypothetical protein Fsol_00722 [Candidatus Fokinia solitaria]